MIINHINKYIILFKNLSQNNITKTMQPITDKICIGVDAFMYPVYENVPRNKVEIKDPGFNF